MNTKIKKAAFTLAEVLITLGIIGIVAQMTIPTLTKNVKDQQLKAMWKKEFSVISQATTSLLNDNGGSFASLCTTNDDQCLADYYAQYLKAIKKCQHGTAGCFWGNGEWKYLSGASIVGWSPDSGLILPDGAILNIEYWNADCSSTTGSVKVCGNIYVDVNGQKLPNQMGKDIFLIHPEPSKISPGGTAGDNMTCITDPPSGSGQGCGARYLMGD